MSLIQRFAGATLKPAITYLSKRSLPQTTGRIQASGLKDEVVIQRDQWGIPHIQATSRHDLFFAQGFVHAQDRLWQMDLNRRVAAGRLAAVLGPEALETDRLTRTLGFARLAEIVWAGISDFVKADVIAYTTGINAFLESNPRLPVEFKLLRYRPEPWQPLDSVAFARLLVWSLSHGWAAELTRAKLIEELGPDLAGELEPGYPERNPITLPEGIQFNTLKPDGMLQAAAGPFINRGFEGGGKGSNGWVISGARSATGHAILCNDMHLPITTPSLWYYLRLRSTPNDHNEEGLQVAGVSQPGIPYVLVGHNNHITWGATLSFIDCEDLYVEKFDEADPTRYLFQGERRPAEVFKERIQVKGRPDHIEEVVVTQHGPLISKIVPANGQALALQAVALTDCVSFEGFSQLNQARDWDGFVAAVKNIESPSLNLLYADTEDNIGYYVSGKIPVRAKGQGLVPSPGWSGDYEWVGDVPFEEMPHALNPAQGYLVSANNRIVDDDYPHYLGSTWMNGYRARRIKELIDGQEIISPADCRRFQLDFHCIPGLELVNSLSELLSFKEETIDPDAVLCLNLLRQWDGWLGPDSVAGTVFEVLLNRLSRTILEPHLGSELTIACLGAGPHPILFPISEFYGHWVVTLLDLLRSPANSPLFIKDEPQDLILRCLSESAAELRQRLGPDSSKWVWGNLHQARFDHTLGIQKPLDRIFNQGPYPIGGDTNTVAQVATAPGDPYGHNAVGPSYRQIVEMGNLAASVAMYAPGQSGHLASKHYGDMIPPWLDGRYFSMALTGDDQNKGEIKTLILSHP